MAMQRQLHFDSDQIDSRTDFRLLLDAFRGTDPKQISATDRHLYAEIQRALYAISFPVDVDGLTVDDGGDPRPRKLQDGVQTLLLSARAHEKLQKLVEDFPYFAWLSVQQQDLLDRLSAAGKVAPSTAGG